MKKIALVLSSLSLFAIVSVQAQTYDDVQALLAYDAEASHYLVEHTPSFNAMSQADYTMLLSQGAATDAQIITREEIASAAHAQDILTLLECDAEATNHMMIAQPNMMTILINASY